MKKFLALILTVIMTVSISGVLTACNEKSNSPETVTVTDMEGTKVVIPKGVDKVACISPSATDLMIAFGLGDKIVGTYRSFTYNPWAAEIYPKAANLRGIVTV